MTEQLPDTARFTEPQKDALNVRDADQDRTLRALHRLERAAGRPASAGPWNQETLAALVALDEATSDEQTNANEPDSLLSDIARTQPRLRNRVRGIRAQHAQIRQIIVDLRKDMTETEFSDRDNIDLRREIARLPSILRYHPARESDLIYEAYFDSFHAEIDN